MNYQIEKKEGHDVHAVLTIPFEAFQKEYNSLLKREVEKTDVKGFRKGKVPTEMIESQLKQALSIEALDRITPEHLTNIVVKEKLELIAPPQFTELPDLTKKEDLKIKIKFTTMPEFKLGDLKKINVKQESSDVKKEEIANTIKEMFTNSTVEEKGKEPNDKWAQKTGELYKLPNIKSLDDLEKEITKLLKSEKERITRQNAEHEIIKKAIEISKIELPKEAIEFESREREKSFLTELRNANLSLEDFCKKNNTEMKQLRVLWEKDAKDALDADALLKLYAKTKEVDITEKELEEGIQNLKMSRGEEIPEDVEKDEMWRGNIKNVLIKQKAYRELMDEVLKK